MVDIPKFEPLVISGETSNECNEVYQISYTLVRKF